MNLYFLRARMSSCTSVSMATGGVESLETFELLWGYAKSTRVPTRVRRNDVVID